MADPSEEHAVLSNTITQNMEEALKPVVALVEDSKDADHKALGRGIIALRSGDKITCARITDTKNAVDAMSETVGRIEIAVSRNRHEPKCFPAGPLKGVPVKYAFYAGCVALCLAAGVLMFAIAHGRLGQVAEAVNILKGTAVRTNEVRIVHAP
jgi:hypothetical protein